MYGHALFSLVNLSTFYIVYKDNIFCGLKLPSSDVWLHVFGPNHGVFERFRFPYVAGPNHLLENYPNELAWLLDPCRSFSPPTF